jgi:general stress protein 26
MAVSSEIEEAQMATDGEIEEKFWKELHASPFLMLGIEGQRDGATQPMTANFQEEDRDKGRLWFFTSNDHDLARALGPSGRVIGAFAAKGHDLFASLRGTLMPDNDRATIGRLWNAVVAQWYESKDDPKLLLLRFEIDNAKIWLSDVEGFLKPVVNKLLGREPETGADEKVAEVSP